MAQVEAFARAHDLAVVEADAARRLIRLAGTATAMSAAFQVQLARVKHPEGTFRTRTGTIKVPAALVPIIEGVFGLDNRPTARAHFRPALTKAGGIAPRNAVGTSYTPPQIAKLYDFPKGVDGTGQTIAIIELGGGYKSTGDFKTPLPSGCILQLLLGGRTCIMRWA
jgi:kumamolisin